MRQAIGKTILALSCAFALSSFAATASAEDFRGVSYFTNETDKYVRITDVLPSGKSLHAVCLHPFSHGSDELSERLSAVRFELKNDDCDSGHLAWTDTVVWNHEGPLPHAAFEYWIKVRPYHVKVEQIVR